MAGVAVLGLAPVAYGVTEARRYRLKSYRIPVLEPGAPTIRILHLSDFHLRLANRKMMRFLKSLHEHSFDLVFATGDLLGEPGAVDVCLRLLKGMKGSTARCFVFGSSDYYAPVLKNYLDYFAKRRHHGARRNPTEQFRSGLTAAGWLDLNNSQTTVRVGGVGIQLTGMDDPYLHREDTTMLQRDSSLELGIVVVHDPAPYKKAIDAGFDLVVSGHTHGGQVRMPLAGALVTNSTLSTGLARGLSRIEPGWLFVTPGLGTGKYAPFRFLCPPEASVLELVPRMRAL